MNSQNRNLKDSPSSLAEALDSLFRRAEELETLSQNGRWGMRMSHIIQTERARLDFQRFKETLSSEIIDLRHSIDAAIAIHESQSLLSV